MKNFLIGALAVICLAIIAGIAISPPKRALVAKTEPGMAAPLHHDTETPEDHRAAVSAEAERVLAEYDARHR